MTQFGSRALRSALKNKKKIKNKDKIRRNVMKKRMKQVAASVMALVSLLATAACNVGGGEVVGPQIDDSKTQIYVSGYNGGNGVVWLEKTAAEWNATNDKYELVVVPNKDSSSIKNEVMTGSGAQKYSIYFSGVSDFQTLIYGNYLEDLSDLLDEEVDGAGKGTVEDKIGVDDTYYDTWKQMATKNGEGMYMLPLSDNFGLMVFDFDAFLEKGFMIYADGSDASVLAALQEQGVSYEKDGSTLYLKEAYTGTTKYFNYEVGDAILSCGKDGKYGTYDDGQPVTEAEFDSLINKIKIDGDNSKAFLWTSKYPDYTDMIINSAMVQYIGVEEEQTYYRYEGPMTINGQTETIDLATGYKVFANDGIKKGVEFAQKYLNNTATAYSESLTGDISHTDAQSYLLYSYQAEAENLEYAHILVEGEWFENEAKPSFKEIERDGRGFGKREYRMLLLPNFEGQKGIDGNGKGSVVSCLNNGAIMVPKESDTDKLNAIKSFILYFLKTENLQRYTVESGSMAAYRYELTDEQYEALSPFSKNCIQMRMDTENIYLSRFSMLHNSDYLKLSSSLMGKVFPYIAESGATAPSVIRALKYQTVDQVCERLANCYSSEIWAQMIKAAQDQGFYQ